MMDEKPKATELFEMADEFINVANRLVELDKKEIGDVGAAIRYAAARFNAHEAAYKAKDLAAERGCTYVVFWAV